MVIFERYKCTGVGVEVQNAGGGCQYQALFERVASAGWRAHRRWGGRLNPTTNFAALDKDEIIGTHRRII